MNLNSIEKDVIANYRDGKIPLFEDQNEELSLTRFSLWIMLNIGKMIRSHRVFPQVKNVSYKEKGSPVTLLEKEIEVFVKGELAKYFPHINFIGEETGGNFSEKDLSLALDPIDGTWSFISQSESYSSSLVISKDNEIIFGAVLNPSSGELGYSSKSSHSRLIQLSMVGENDISVDLPLINSSNENKLLVNIHPSKYARNIINNLYNSWELGKIKFIKSIGGSPSLALLEAAKGYFTYVNLWEKQPSLIYDLAAGVIIIRGAGGEVLDKYENPIKYWGHKGPFVGGISRDNFKKLISKGKILNYEI
jgi:fructose-1,6-bisphosphatase/inositol monophosphatase family enzyme